MNDIALNTPVSPLSSDALQKSLLRLSELSCLAPNWDGEQAVSPSVQSVKECESFLKIWAEKSFGSMPSIYPMQSGGLQLEWSDEQWDVEVAFPNTINSIQVEVFNKKAEQMYSEQWDFDAERVSQRLDACSKQGHFQWVSSDAFLQKQVKECWLNHINVTPKEVTADQHAVYALLRGKSLEKTFPPKKRGNDETRVEVRSQSVQKALSLNCRAWKPWKSLLEEQGALLDAKDGVMRWHSNYAKTPSTPLFDRAFAAK